MRRSEALPTRFFKAESYDGGWQLDVEIEVTRIEEIGSDGKKQSKPVVYFQKVKQGLVAGPTIWDQICEVTNEQDSDDWPGNWVQLHRDWTNFGGKRVKCIRVRAVPERAPSKKQPPPSPKKSRSKGTAATTENPATARKPDFNDDVTF